MTYTKNLLDINKAIEKAYAENYGYGWTDQEMKDVIEETEFINDKKALCAEEVL